MIALYTNLFIIGTVLILGYFQVYRPTRAYYRKKHQRDAARLYREFQIYSVKRYYKGLSGLSCSEIEERYNVSRAYDRIGR